MIPNYFNRKDNNFIDYLDSEVISSLNEADRQKFVHIIDNEEELNKFQKLDVWLRENGSTYPKLELRDFGNEVRGCHSIEDIENDETIIFIPLKCLITVEMGKNTAVGKQILQSTIQLDAPKHIFLMLFILIDMKNPQSFFKPYYDILPKTMYNMPIFWKPHELDYLKGSYILYQIEERIATIEADYNAICDISPEFPSYATLQEFQWARMIVCSRNFGLIVNGIRTAAIVPYADMLNHHRPRETKWQFEDHLQGFTVTSLQRIPASSQIFDSYGMKCNHRFLLNYGFSVESNIEADGSNPNEVPVLFQLKSTDENFEQKLLSWRTESPLLHRRIRIAIANNESTRSCFALLRILAADEYDLHYLTESINKLESSNLPYSYNHLQDIRIGLNKDNEYRALKIFEGLCKNLLMKYPSSYEVDVLRLEARNSNGEYLVTPFSNERNALIQVKGEKEILLFYLKLCEIGMKLLNINDMNELKDKVLELDKKENDVLCEYVRNVIFRLKYEEMKKSSLEDNSNRTFQLSSFSRYLKQVI